VSCTLIDWYWWHPTRTTPIIVLVLKMKIDTRHMKITALKMTTVSFHVNLTRIVDATTLQSTARRQQNAWQEDCGMHTTNRVG
jgi:hypothetical protein